MAASIRNAPLPRFEIAEDSTLFKALSCIPVLGAIPSLIQQVSVNKTITNMPFHSDVQIIELIEVKNDYKKASIINGLFTIAIGFLLLSFGFVSLPSFFLGFGISYTVQNIWTIYKNKELIEQIRSTGVPFRMEIH